MHLNNIELNTPPCITSSLIINILDFRLIGSTVVAIISSFRTPCRLSESALLPPRYYSYWALLFINILLFQSFDIVLSFYAHWIILDKRSVTFSPTYLIISSQCNFPIFSFPIIFVLNAIFLFTSQFWIYYLLIL